MRIHLKLFRLTSIWLLVAGLIFCCFSCSNSKSSSHKKVQEPSSEPPEEEEDDDPTIGVEPNIYTNGLGSAFVALREDGSIITWGTGDDAAKNASIKAQLGSSKVVSIYSTQKDFAALTSNGEVITWGSSDYVGNINPEDLTNVKDVKASQGAFIALKNNGSVVRWGDPNSGGEGDTSYINETSSGVSEIYGTAGGFAVKMDAGTVYSWGKDLFNINAKSDQKYEHTTKVDKVIAASESCLTAVNKDYTVTYWGKCFSTNEQTDKYVDTPTDFKLSPGYKIYTTSKAFAALLSDGSVYSWGHESYGGKMSSTISKSTSKEIYSHNQGFVALMGGNVVVWGGRVNGANNNPAFTNIKNIYPGKQLFAALKTEKSGKKTEKKSAIIWGVIGPANSTTTIYREIPEKDSENVKENVKKVFVGGNNFFFVKDNYKNSICIEKKGNDGKRILNCFDRIIKDAKVKRVYFTTDIDDGGNDVAILTTEGRILFLDSSDDYKEVKTLFSDKPKAVGIVPNQHAFAALLSDGSVVSWRGSQKQETGGTMSESVASELNGTIKVLPKSN